MKEHNSTNERLRALSDGYEAPYPEGAWEQMEQLLPPTPPDDDARGFFNFKIILGMITFFVLFFLGLQYWETPQAINSTAENTIQLAPETTLSDSEQVLPEVLTTTTTNNLPSTTEQQNATPTAKKTSQIPTTAKRSPNHQAFFPISPYYTADLRIPFLPLPITPAPPTANPDPFQDFPQELRQRMQEQQLHYSPEKIYLHLDRSFFEPGEDIWFSVYLRDARTLKRSPQSDIVYVELIGPNGKVIETRSLLAAAGKAAGDFSTSADAPGGTYQLKAYTNWQKNTDAFFMRELTLQKTVLPQLRMELDFVRKSYGPGDEVQAFLKVQSLASNVKIAEEQEYRYSLQMEGEETWQQTGKLDATGQAKIQFKLPETLATNDALLNIEIVHQDQTEAIARAVPIIDRQIDLQFFPEGGQAIAGLTSELAFKALGQNGKAVDVEGVIYDSQDQEVLRFRSYHQGMGQVEWTPKAGEIYTAKVTRPSGIEADFQVPGALEKGYALSILDKEEDQIKVSVHSSENNPILLAVQSQSELYQIYQDEMRWGEKIFSIPTHDLPMGIVQLTLFDQHKTPRAERLVFVNPQRQLDIQVRTDKEKYLPREAVKMEIEVKDSEGKPMAGQFSLAVVDDNLLTYADDRQGHILSHLLLESELRGTIEEPNFYFDPPKFDDGKDRQLALDQLLMTQGWRRFDWTKTLGKQYAQMNIPGEKAELSGLLVDRKGYPIEGGIIKLQGETGPELKGYTNRQGYFNFSRLEHFKGYENLKTPTGQLVGLQLHRPGKYFYKADLPNGQVEFLTTPIIYPANGLREVRGKVFDINIGEGLIGCNVLLEGTTVGVITDFEGNFTLRIPENLPNSELNLKVNYIGYSSKVIPILVGRDEILRIDIPMQEDLIQLQEVVVTGLNIRATRKSKSDKAKRNKKATKAKKPEKINDLPTRSIDKIAAEVAGVSAEKKRSKKAKNSEEKEQAITANDLINANRTVDLDLEQDQELSLKRKKKEERVQRQLAKELKVLSEFYLAREFYAPRYESKKQPKLRDDFRSTIYWNPNVDIDYSGKASLQFYNSDEISTFKTIIEGIGVKGELGRTSQTHFTQLPLEMGVKIPPSLLTGDQVRIPLQLRNHSNQDLTGRLAIKTPKHWQRSKNDTDQYQLAAGSTKTIYLEYELLPNAASGELEIATSALGLSDAFSQKVTVKRRGFPINEVYSGRQQKSAFDLDIGQVQEGSMSAVFNAYPDPIGDISAGLDRMLRQPTGCFEQTSSKNYPNLLVLDYLRATNKVDLDLERRISNLLAAGYDRLLSYEVKGGGFDWYGQSPAHGGLTAYGLMQFVDMQKVYPVEQNLIDRTAEWLLRQRVGDQGWRVVNGRNRRWSGGTATFDAYIAWAVAEAGYGHRLRKEVDMIYDEALQSKDAYFLGIATNLLHRVRDKRANDILDRLIDLQLEDGSWRGDSYSWTYSQGRALTIETTALTVLAILQQKNYRKEMEKGVGYLAAAKTGYGFGSTQSTVMALKALTEYAKTYWNEVEKCQVSISVDGEVVVKKKFNKTTDRNLQIRSLEKYLGTGKHRIEIAFDQASSAMPFDFTLDYYTSLPVQQAACQIKLATRLQKNQAKVGESLRLMVELRNSSQDELANPIALIGIPAGLSLQTWQLKDLVEKGYCDYYELWDNYLVLHYRQIEAAGERQIPLDLKVEIPGDFEAPASVAYQYYDEEYRHWVAPERVKIEP